MKLYTQTKNSKGKIKGLGDNSAIEIILTAHNNQIGRLDYAIENDTLVVDYTGIQGAQRLHEGKLKGKS